MCLHRGFGFRVRLRTGRDLDWGDRSFASWLSGLCSSEPQSRTAANPEVQKPRVSGAGFCAEFCLLPKCLGFEG